MRDLVLVLCIAMVWGMSACSSSQSQENHQADNGNMQAMKEEIKKRDVHTLSNYDEIRTTHLDMKMNVNFDKQILRGTASLKFDRVKDVPSLFLDTKDLIIKEVALGVKKEPTDFKLHDEVEHLGQALEITLDDTSNIVHILYETKPGSDAIMWLSPEQTLDKNHPFMFTQGEAVLTRSWIPCQDSPDNKITYSARIETPKELLAVMSAENLNPKNDLGVYNFKLEQPIPTYLIALAVGDLEFEIIDYRTGVYAEPSMAKKAKKEFEDVGKMLNAAEALYGKYAWGRYDIIVLPPSFPFGGMENPRLTFATPTIIAGDKSLTTLIAHEMAHSWSGNLVTNATWDDFWLNEGFTVYFERRIMEALYGKDYVDMLRVLGYQDLQSEYTALVEDNMIDDTRLKLSLEGRNPDDGMTDIAYEKGAFFLSYVENQVGREKFDQFLTNYFSRNKFQSITTEDFVAELKSKLLDPNGVAIDVEKWIYQKGIPESLEKPVAERFDKVEGFLENWIAGNYDKSITNDWSTHEWLHFLRNVPKDIGKTELDRMEKDFGFSQSGNSEILFAWFKIAIEHKYSPVKSGVENFLTEVGRRKFLTPLYRKMVETGQKEWALEIYEKARPNYHFVSTNTLDALLGYTPES